MRFSYLLPATVSLCNGIVNSHPIEEDISQLNPTLSFPDLLSLPPSTIPLNWAIGDDTKLEEGRFILTPGKDSKGSIWQKNQLFLEDSITIEWTFRSRNFDGISKGGLSFWLLSDDKLSREEQLFNKDLYNGPSKFDGLQILIDNNGPIGPSIHAILNDGSKILDGGKIYKESFTSCLFGYQDSPVPSTLRLTYNIDDKNLLKLQIDNKICFQTRKILLPLNSNYIFGSTAKNDITNSESFEILKMNFFDGIISKSLIPNVNELSQPIIMKKIIDSKTGKEQIVEKSIYDSEHEKLSSFQLYKKIDKLEGEIIANDIGKLNIQLDNALETHEELMKQLAIIGSRLDYLMQQKVGKTEREEEDLDMYNHFLSLNDKLGLLLAEQEKLREKTKIDEQSRHSVIPKYDDLFRRILYWLIPLMLMLLLMTYYTFRIKQEIVKAKVL
ncbi:hypothetical protein TBLA_0C00300 [Henningerozyma blattae CBS 6284]|uniref:L-type lectin-like domain-containing protein n=1 Tax=Henningerozyma blattae (strain ATCC 34711 / CBS 6284 / DSM 70876 / NBRC 10599 / NRRL Y-10934 / UCD 77-7) TaxID=1071380 RepID=I2H0E5_HENB6|nr:hypothetical protein TBLA_0C00300 [Tetrapisispora blattae CBS 6284]CCH59847.1 hypothetical protein TBLA_0C00300 [Tetrapisispora blattae CBS 6284]